MQIDLTTTTIVEWIIVPGGLGIWSVLKYIKKTIAKEFNDFKTDVDALSDEFDVMKTDLQKIELTTQTNTNGQSYIEKVHERIERIEDSLNQKIEATNRNMYTSIQKLSDKISTISGFLKGAGQ